MDANPEQTQAVYQENAVAYDAQRSRALFEARWLARFTACLPDGGRVLDLGCGAGEPIAQWFIAEGFRLTGIDFAGAMLDIARARWPHGDWRLADMRVLDLSETFDGIIAWNSFFCLTKDEQRLTLGRMARHLAPGGALLFTIAPEVCETPDTVAGQRVFQSNLSLIEYATLLEANGLRLTAYMAEDPDCKCQSIIMARKKKD